MVPTDPLHPLSSFISLRHKELGVLSQRYHSYRPRHHFYHIQGNNVPRPFALFRCVYLNGDQSFGSVYRVPCHRARHFITAERGCIPYCREEGRATCPPKSTNPTP